MHGLYFSRINLKTVLAPNETRIQGAVVECRTRGFVFIKHQWPNKFVFVLIVVTTAALVKN